MNDPAPMLKPTRFIAIPGAETTGFDHGAFDPGTGRVFVAHTAKSAVEVLDTTTGRHENTVPGFPEAAGIVVDGGLVAVTSRGAARLSILDAETLVCTDTVATGPRPNGVALAAQRSLAVVACLGSGDTPPTLECIDLGGGAARTLSLPGRPRWCVVDAAAERAFVAIQNPSLVEVVHLPDCVEVARWPLPTRGAHGIDLDPASGRLYVACDGGWLVAVETGTGGVVGQWALPGVPDATCFNPDSGYVHVAVGDPGVVVSVAPGAGRRAFCSTEMGAKTTALARPDRVYVFLPQRGGALELVEAGEGTTVA